MALKDGAKMVPRRKKKHIGVGDYVKFYDPSCDRLVVGLVEKRSADGWLWAWVYQVGGPGKTHCLPESVCKKVNPPGLIGG